MLYIWGPWRSHIISQPGNLELQWTNRRPRYRRKNNIVTCLRYWRRRSDCYFVLLRLHYSSLHFLLQCALASWLRLWSVRFDLLFLLKSTLLSRSTPEWCENTLSKGCLLSSTQRLLVLLRNPTIRSLFVVAGKRYLCLCLGIPSRWLTMLLVM
jgi:hypothetical protein